MISPPQQDGEGGGRMSRIDSFGLEIGDGTDLSMVLAGRLTCKTVRSR